MSKKNKFLKDSEKDMQPSIDFDAELSGSATFTDEPIAPTPEPTPAPEPTQEPEQTFELHDAARRFVAGWQDRWLAGLQAYANQMGIPQAATESAFKQLFQRFGLKLS